MSSTPAAKFVLLDLLMATMDSMSVWAVAAGDRNLGLRWRDAVTERMIARGEYAPYEELVLDAAAALHLPAAVGQDLRAAWKQIRAWPDATALEGTRPPYGFVTNCSTGLAAIAVERSGLRPAFTLSAEEAGWYKPRSEIYRLACDRFGAKPAETLFVAGAAYDARGASDAGLQAVLIARRPMPETPAADIDVVPSLHDALARVPRSRSAC